jgi:hypothetical protein
MRSWALISNKIYNLNFAIGEKDDTGHQNKIPIPLGKIQRVNSFSIIAICYSSYKSIVLMKGPAFKRDFQSKLNSGLYNTYYMKSEKPIEENI